MRLLCSPRLIGEAGDEVTKKPPVVRAALCIYVGVCYFFTLTGAILTTNRSLIIRTTIRMTIRERLKRELICV